MPDAVKTRLYRSPLRAARAAATRGAVLDAARELFADRGYAATSVAEVARRAGVSVDTVYTAVGRKPQLLLAIHDLELAGGVDGVASPQRDYVAVVRAAPTARAKLEVYAAALADRLPRVVPLLESLQEAARTDPECAAVLESLERRRREMMGHLAHDLRAGGGLRRDLDDREVAHRLWMANSAAYYRLSTADGRSPQDYAALVLETWVATLLAD
ncbi:TetR/AcrR family transcriptional regulator [Phycicoccus sp. DTK01]|uniref:TetR/AcrR family transcriptional regulator n=1 Tax=Phycicoccus sp. DTK01 TaxID=2785745 RepID=UPI001AAA2D12|nr:TetR/AcrR family transcriptional regulator [Phycicoccus sp. DTK01]GIL35792.1 DNA-binding protein [Phycicoccus sp. DTK01]